MTSLILLSAGIALVLRYQIAGRVSRLLVALVLLTVLAHWVA